MNNPGFLSRRRQGRVIITGSCEKSFRYISRYSCVHNLGVGLAQQAADGRRMRPHDPRRKSWPTAGAPSGLRSPPTRQSS